MTKIILSSWCRMMLYRGVLILHFKGAETPKNKLAKVGVVVKRIIEGRELEETGIGEMRRCPKSNRSF